MSVRATFALTAAKAPPPVSSSQVGMLGIGRLHDVGTRATVARPTVLPIRILQLFTVAHLVYFVRCREQKIRLAIASICSLIVETESVSN